MRLKLWGANGPAPEQTKASPFTASVAAERAGWAYPALGWLDEIATRFGGRIVFVYVPAHIAAQPKPGSRKAAWREECKARIAAIARRHEAPFIDFDLNSEITALDANWWDRLHYRLPIADRIVKDIEQALVTGKDDPNGHWRYWKGPRPGTRSLTSQ